jgi:hypothetical protein
MGVFYAWYYAAMALLPGMAGWARDLKNDAAAPVLFAAGMMVVAAGCLTAFRAASGRPSARAVQSGDSRGSITVRGR